MRFWIGPQESSVLFSVPRGNRVSERNPRSAQGSAANAVVSVRILKRWERSDLPASAGQEKAWLSPCHLATALPPAALDPTSDRGAVRVGSSTQTPTAFVSGRLPSPSASVQRALLREARPRGCSRDFHRVLTSHRIYSWAQAPKQPAESKRSQKVTPEDMPKVVGSGVRGMLKHKGCKVKQTQAFKDRKIIE